MSFEQLHERARTELTGTTDFSQSHTLVQFAGFPRSGHSIVGSMIDAHADALVSHEADILGLVEAGFSMEETYALIAENSAEFEANGRFWNGHCYHVPGATGGRSATPLVVGDKKGDWAIRRLADDPTILTRFSTAFPGVRTAWICIVRNPFDNVATLSLRRSRHYDEMRIDAATHAEFKRRIAEQRSSGTNRILPEMLEDYAALCAGVEAVKAVVDPNDWLEVRHEDFVASPAATMKRIFGYLGLAADPAVAEGAEQIVRASANRSRHDIEWSVDDIDSVQAMVDRHDFLRTYVFDEPDVNGDEAVLRPSASASSRHQSNTLDGAQSQLLPADAADELAKQQSFEDDDEPIGDPDEPVPPDESGTADTLSSWKARLIPPDTSTGHRLRVVYYRWRRNVARRLGR